MLVKEELTGCNLLAYARGMDIVPRRLVPVVTRLKNVPLGQLASPGFPGYAFKA